jgi:hypothetical protein
MKTSSASRCFALRKKVENIENDLKAFYLARIHKMENKAVSRIKSNPKAFYAYAKRFQKSFSGIGPLMKPNGEIISSPEDIAEALKQQYESVYSIPIEDKKVKDAKEFFEKDDNAKITDLLVTYEDVKDAIDKLSRNASAGPDGIPAILLSEGGQR